MGHYKSEMWSPFQDPRVWADYKRRLGKEIDKTIKKNKIKIREINSGDKLKLYEGLEKKSKVKPTKGYKASGKIKEKLFAKLSQSTLDYIKPPFVKNHPITAEEVNYEKGLIYLTRKNSIIPICIGPKYFSKVNQ